MAAWHALVVMIAAAAPSCQPVAGHPVRIVHGHVSCARARSALRFFLEKGTPPRGWFCARGHGTQPYAAQCATTSGASALVRALNKPVISGPATARIGTMVRVAATGVSAARYTLTVVYDRPPAHNARCLADVGSPVTSRGGTVVLKGTVPTMLTCYQGTSIKLGSVATAPGAYHFVVGRKLAPNGWDADATFLRRGVRLVS